MKSKDMSAYGTWHVTTGGDVEGKSTREIGVYTGYFDEIALALAKEATFNLKFERVSPKVPKSRGADSVDVMLNIESGTWDMTPISRVNYYNTLLQGRPVEVTDSNYFACVRIYKPGKAPKQPSVREVALSKLTAEEKRALGLS